MIAVWFSNGAPSACALKLAINRFGSEHVRALNNPVAEEDEDNLRFAKEVGIWCGVTVERVAHPDFPAGRAEDVWEHKKAMSFVHGAPCTTILKTGARQHWEKSNYVRWHVLGFTLEEKKRHERFVLTERANVLPLLIQHEMTRDDCAHMLAGAGIALPRVYGWGLPNANCLGCVKATSPTYWNLIRRTVPDVFQRRAVQSRRLGVRLVRYKGARIFLDELPADAVGRPIKIMPDCGTFCEERTDL